MPHHNVFLPYVNRPAASPPEDSIANITISSGYRRQYVRFLTTFLPKNYLPSYNFGPRAGLRGATFGCAFFSPGGSTIRSLSFSALRS